jgi:hypothetical protein
MCRNGWRVRKFQQGGALHASTAAAWRRRESRCAAPQSDGGWDGCETINAFRFTGIPDIDVVWDHADRPLRDLHAEAITTHTLIPPQLPGTTAVRSSGCFSAAGLWIWAQYSTFIAGSIRADQGQLIQHSVFVESGCQARLNDNVIQLSDAIYQAFLTDIDTR